MTIKLVKRDQQAAANEKTPQQPSMTQVLLTTQSWVEEFKARKSRGVSALFNQSSHS
jgi:hypothetical protein